jgi:hypothetical protein
MMCRSAFGGAWTNFLEQSTGRSGEWDGIMSVSGMGTGLGPHVGLKHPINVWFTTELDVVSGLENVNAIEVGTVSLIGGGMLIDETNEFLGDGSIVTGDGIIINLLADKNSHWSYRQR